MSEHWVGVIVAVIRAVYGLPAKYVGYMGLVWAELGNNSVIMGCFSAVG